VNPSEPSITNDTVFRTKSVPSQEPEIAPQAIETPGVVKDPTGITPLQNLPKIDNLEVWETENRRQYAQDYFGIRETAHIFPMSMQFKHVDKFIKGELQERGYENTLTNYQKVIQEIEEEIGSKSLLSFKRLQRLSDYIRVIQKQKELKAKEESYKLYKNE
jgi:hypothetical protein